MTDADLDRAFTPSKRPQSYAPPCVAPARPHTLTRPSALALAFASQLNDIFLIDDQLDRLDRTVNRK